MTKKLKQVYYSVWVGNKVGVFNSWSDARQSTDGYSGSAHHKFDSYDDAIRKVKEELTKQGYAPPFNYHDCNEEDSPLW